MNSSDKSELTSHVKIRTRFWFQIALGILFAVLLILTIAEPDWIEEVFKVDPDMSNGALEWAIVAVCAVAVVVSLALARLEWRRAVRLSADSVTD